jgi:hypothetical protein
MDPIRPITSRDDAIAAVVGVAESHVRRETPEEAHERRKREARDGEHRRARQAWAHSQVSRTPPPEPVLVHEDESDDGHAHCDIRV